MSREEQEMQPGEAWYLGIHMEKIRVGAGLIFVAIKWLMENMFEELFGDDEEERMIGPEQLDEVVLESGNAG